MTSIQSLQADRSHFHGHLPTELGELGAAGWIGFGDSVLSGTLPSQLGQLGSLVSLELGRNNISGTLPEAFGNLGSIEHIGLENNTLSGTVRRHHPTPRTQDSRTSRRYA